MQCVVAWALMQTSRVIQLSLELMQHKKKGEAEASPMILK